MSIVSYHAPTYLSRYKCMKVQYVCRDKEYEFNFVPAIFEFCLPIIIVIVLFVVAFDSQSARVAFRSIRCLCLW